MKWLRVLLVVLALGAVSCSNPAAPRFPDPGEEEENGPTDPGPNNGFYFVPDQVPSFFV